MTTTALLPGATAPATTTSTPAEVVADSERLGELTVEVVSSIPANTRRVDGLTFYDGRLFASVSQPSGRQSIDPDSGEVDLDLTFAETVELGGIAVWEGVIIQISAGGNSVELIDPGSLALLAALETEGPAIGVCAFTEEVVVSNGTTELAFRDPMSFQLARTLSVPDPLAADGLGELVCANGQLWAVTGGSTTMARIDIITGEIIASIDLAGLGQLVSDETDLSGAISGIAHRPATDTFFVAGDGWNTIVEVRLVTAG